MSALILKTLWIYGLAAGVSLLIALVIRVIVLILDRAERSAAPGVPAGEPPPRRADEPEADARHVAAISAAVYVATGAHRIVHIEDTERGAGWAAEGRHAHHASHAPAIRPAKR